MKAARSLIPLCFIGTAAGLGWHWVGEVPAEAASRVTAVEPFNRLELRGAAQVRIEQVDAGQEARVELSGVDGVLEQVEVEVADRTLVIAIDDDAIDDRTDLAIAITTPAPLTKIVSSGSFEVAALGLRGGGELTIEERGAGSYHVDDLDVDELVVHSRGAAEFSIAGVVRRQAINMAGAGAYDAEALRSAVAEIRITGAGSATVYATETLDVTIAGAGAVRYAGDPEVRQRIYGAGAIKQLNSH